MEWPPHRPPHLCHLEAQCTSHLSPVHSFSLLFSLNVLPPLQSLGFSLFSLGHLTLISPSYPLIPHHRHHHPALITIFCTPTLISFTPPAPSVSFSSAQLSRPH